MYRRKKINQRRILPGWQRGRENSRNNGVEMITDLRFIERDGERVLQMGKEFTCINNMTGSRKIEVRWKDVPIVKEEENEHTAV